MSHTVLVLGAGGRFGRAAVDAFRDAGCQVRAFRRSWQGVAVPAGVEPVAGNAFDAGVVSAAAAGCAVIVNALNPPYPRWRQDLPHLTDSVIRAARASGATVTLPSNVYNYGAGMPARLTEETPQAPTTRKGRLRAEMEQTYAQAADDGVQTIILRAGDFIERQRTGNWFDSHIAAKVAQGRALYPGPLDRVHAWAYLPDMARAMAALAAIRAQLARFETFGFAGYALTGRELIDAMERAAGQPLKVSGVPWPLFRLLGLVSPMLREVVEMAYLWRVPHTIDGNRLATTLPDFRPTPLDAAITDALGATAPDAAPQQGLSQPA